MTATAWPIAYSTGGPLTQDVLMDAMERVRVEPPRRCPHIHSYTHVSDLRERGVLVTTCHWCGHLVSTGA